MAAEKGFAGLMRHRVPIESLGPMGAPMAEAIQACVHCGFCLAACPTYKELGQEMDSPRGRIVLMKEVLEGELGLEEAAPHVDRCLGCLACEPACPSGVSYRELISPFRALMEDRRKRGLGERLRRWMLMQILPYPKRFYVASQLGRVVKRLRGVLPGPLKIMLELMPEGPPARPRSCAERVPARGKRRARVGLLLGCAQRVVAPEINEATVALLSYHGVEVVVPPDQGCCGALAWHVGNGSQARDHARRNLDAFPVRDLDAIVTNAAGCGSGLSEYPLMLRGEVDGDGLKRFADKVMDVTSFLYQLGMDPPEAKGPPLKVAYQDACHLSHGQGVREAPRQLLQGCGSIQLLEIPDPHLCCGSAGSFNLDQPEIAASLGREKAARIAATGCEAVATGNVGCLMQLRMHLRRLGQRIPVKHTMQILAEAYGLPPSARS